MIDTPDLALRNQILGIAGSRLESIGEAHHILDILLLSRLGQYVCFLCSQGDGLFQVKRLAGFHGSHCHLEVGVIRGADIHCIYNVTVNQISIIRKTVLRRNPILLANGFELFLINVADGHQGQIGTLGNTGLVHAAPDGSYAYRSYANNFLFHVEHNSFKLSYKLNKINLFFPESLQRREEFPPRWHSEPLQRPFHLTNRGRNFPTTCSFGDNLCC